MKRVFITAVAVLVLTVVGILVFQNLWEPGSEQREVPVADRAAQLRQGAYLATAGNCMTCHTARGGPAYAGGRALSTPFGTMYAPNLTPEPSTGIGSWSSDDFWRALHNGKSKDGSLLYPAFPYPSYTKVSRADSDAMFAYFRSLAPVRQANREHALRFPYNQRALLAFWRTLYFTPGEYEAQPARDSTWNRGAYLVQGLGHCAACHAPRNALGASLGENRLDGGAVGSQGWHASPLGGPGDVAQLSSLLQHGVSDTNAVYGPMADVVASSLQHLQASDIHAMSSYLVTLPEPVVAPMASGAPSQAVLQLGSKIYLAQCASCHGEQGEGVARAYPALAPQAPANSSNAIRMVLDGGYAPSTAGNPRPYGMPPFSSVLSDTEIAAVLSYVNASWGNRGAPVPPHAVERLRSAQ